MKLKIAIVSLFLAGVLTAAAHDFSVVVGGQELYFNITDKNKKTVSVTYKGKISDKVEPAVSGKIEIPSKVRTDREVYTVTGIGPKAFANARKLTGINIPAGVTVIGDFAFEGCDSLQSIMFPDNDIKFGEGVFFKCVSIKDVALGIDWKSVDLTMFRWSKQLKNIIITPKIVQIKGAKKLKYLETFTVDASNKVFSSYEGLLYNREGTTLYACPRSYVGAVKVKESTQIVNNGALIDCVNVSEIDFPASLNTVSFRETSRMKHLKNITMHRSEPLKNAFLKGIGYFLFQVANPKVTIFVPAEDKAAYMDSLATETGEYSETPGGVPYVVTSEQMPAKKNIKAVKKQ